MWGQYYWELLSSTDWSLPNHRGTTSSWNVQGEHEMILCTPSTPSQKYIQKKRGNFCSALISLNICNKINTESKTVFIFLHRKDCWTYKNLLTALSSCHTFKNFLKQFLSSFDWLGSMHLLLALATYWIRIFIVFTIFLSLMLFSALKINEVL